MIDWSQPKEKEIDWSQPKQETQEFSKPKGKPTLKEIIEMAYGPEGMQERREFETYGRQNVPKVGANLGLGALQETADFIPNLLSSIGIDLPRGDVTQLAPDIEQQEAIQGVGRSIPHVYALTKGLNALNKIPKITPKNAIGRYMSDIGKVGGLEYLLSPPEHKGEAAFYGAGLTAIFNPLFAGLGRLIGPNRGNILSGKFKQASEHEAAIQEASNVQEKILNETKLKGAQQLGEESFQRGENIENLQSAIKEKIPQSESQNISDLADKVKTAHEEIQNEYHQMYEDFKASPSGQKIVKKPAALEEIEKFNLKNVPKELQSDIDKYIGKKEEIPGYTDIIQGKVHPKTIVHQGEGNVQNYIDISKKARDEKLKYSKKSKDRNATISQKEKYKKLASEYGKFQNYIDDKIKSSLDLPEVMQYQKIQDFFRNYEVPFRESNLFKKAVSQRPKIKTNDFFGSMIRENEPKLVERLLEKHPEVKEAITKHDLMNVDFTSPREIEKLLSGDRGKALAENVKNDLRNLHSEMIQKQRVDKLITEIGKSELSIAKKYPKLNKIFIDRPDLRVPFENIEKETARLNDIKKQLESAGMSKKEAEIALKDYKESVRGLGSLLSIVLGNKVYHGAKGVTNLMSANK